jgi:hypothetical protein
VLLLANVTRQNVIYLVSCFLLAIFDSHSYTIPLKFLLSISDFYVVIYSLYLFSSRLCIKYGNSYLLSVPCFE